MLGKIVTLYVKSGGAEWKGGGEETSHLFPMPAHHMHPRSGISATVSWRPRVPRAASLSYCLVLMKPNSRPGDNLAAALWPAQTHDQSTVRTTGASEEMQKRRLFWQVCPNGQARYCRLKLSQAAVCYMSQEGAHDECSLWPWRHSESKSAWPLWCTSHMFTQGTVLPSFY